MNEASASWFVDCGERGAPGSLTVGDESVNEALASWYVDCGGERGALEMGNEESVKEALTL